RRRARRSRRAPSSTPAALTRRRAGTPARANRAARAPADRRSCRLEAPVQRDQPQLGGLVPRVRADLIRRPGCALDARDARVFGLDRAAQLLAPLATLAIARQRDELLVASDCGV